MKNRLHQNQSHYSAAHEKSEKPGGAAENQKALLINEMRNKKKSKTPVIKRQNDPKIPVPPKTATLTLQIKGKNTVLSKTGPQPKGD